MLIRGFLRVAATLALLAIATHAQAEPPAIYKWVDENGIAHYTTDRDKIPGAIRNRVESRGAATPAKAPDVAAPPYREDLMRDVVHTAPAAAAGGEPIAAPVEPATDVAAIAAPGAAEPEAAGGAIRPEAAGGAIEPEAAGEATPELEAESEATTAPEAETTAIAAPAPLSQDVRDELSAVSAPPPAPIIPLDPEQQAAVNELDQQIEGIQSEIAKREETLAALISTTDEQRTTPLVDDPAFREISQRLPKLQADLQTLRERRNKIQPAASTP